MSGRLLLLALASLAFVGCGSVSTASLEGSADATAAETSRFEIDWKLVGEEALGKSDLGSYGLFDYPNERGLMRMDSAGSPVDEIPSEFRLIGDTSYERWVFDGKTYWVKDDAPELSGDPAELLVPFPGGPTKPTDVLTRVLRASDTTEDLGKDDVRGVETTHYRAKVDGQKLLEQLPPSGRRHDPEEVWGGRFLPVELWIDEESRLRRIRLTEDFGDDGPDAMVVTIELFDYGVEVDVDPPPAEQVISEKELERLQAEAWETQLVPESGKAEPEYSEQVCKWAREELPEKDAEEFCRKEKK